MAVVLSLLVILPALAENTDGHSYQGRTLNDELIVGVFADVLKPRIHDADAPLPLSLVTDPANLTGLTCWAMATLLLQTARDTFFNGKLYVSNQDDAFSTVLVTHLADFPDGVVPDCVSVRIRNENTGEQITLNLVPTSTDSNGCGRHGLAYRYALTSRTTSRLWIVTARTRWTSTTGRTFVTDDGGVRHHRQGHNGVPVDDVDGCHR